MYIGIISTGIMAVAVISGIARGFLKKLKVSASQALILLLVVALGFVITPIITPSVWWGFGGICLIVLAVFWLILGNNARLFLLNLLSIIAVSSLNLAFYFFAPELMLHYGGVAAMALTTATATYFLAHGARSGIIICILSVFAADLIAFFSGAYPVDTLAIGASPQFDAMLLAISGFVILYCVIGFFVTRYKTSSKLVNKFEAASMWEEEQN